MVLTHLQIVEAKLSNSYTSSLWERWLGGVSMLICLYHANAYIHADAHAKSKKKICQKVQCHAHMQRFPNTTLHDAHLVPSIASNALRALQHKKKERWEGMPLRIKIQIDQKRRTKEKRYNYNGASSKKPFSTSSAKTGYVCQVRPLLLLRASRLARM